MNMKTLAEHCGVSTATVSYALRDDPRITETVRKRIQQKAKELGYRNNPLSASLVAYRQGVGAKPIQQTVAVLYSNPATSRRSILFKPHLEILRQRLGQYGYVLKEFYLNDCQLSAEKLAPTLHDQGIRGIVLAWGDWGSRLEKFPWNEFVVVSAERNEIHPSIDRVSMNHFSATDEAFERLRIAGASRIGLICYDDLPMRVKKNIVGAYLMNHHQDEGCTAEIPPYFYSMGESTERFEKWFETYHPDGLLSHRIIDLKFFSDAGLSFPKDANYAVIEVDDVRSTTESCLIMNDELGQVLADTIAGKLHYNDHVDLSSEGNLILVDGQWQPGKTTRPAKK